MPLYRCATLNTVIIPANPPKCPRGAVVSPMSTHARYMSSDSVYTIELDETVASKYVDLGLLKLASTPPVVPSVVAEVPSVAAEIPTAAVEVSTEQPVQSVVAPVPVPTVEVTKPKSKSKWKPTKVESDVEAPSAVAPAESADTIALRQRYDVE